MEWKLKRNSRFRLKTEDTLLWENITRRMLKDLMWKKRHCPFKSSAQKPSRPTEAPQISYKRFKSGIVRRLVAEERPVASSPVNTRGRHSLCYEFGSVCQRLSLDSPPGGAAISTSGDAESSQQEAVRWWRHSKVDDVITSSDGGNVPVGEKAPEQDWVWTEPGGAARRREEMGGGPEAQQQPFSVVDRATGIPQRSSQLQMTLAAPSLLDDYYTNLLEWSRSGLVALALGSAVYLWNPDTLSLEGSIQRASPIPGPPSLLPQADSISCVSCSRDGRTLSIGTRQGEVQWWDVERRARLRCVRSHHSVVRTLSWNQNILTSGSVLGRIHHHDTRAPAPLLGASHQQGGVCGLEWSPSGDWLASGSTDGLLNIWANDPGASRARRPVLTMTQPGAVKALGWCPWQRELVATGGGRSDGVLRIWDVQSGTCLNSAQTNSQICSLRWAEEKRSLFTGHGLPHHQICCWDPTSLLRSHQLHGHCGRVLHLAVSPCGTHILSAGADCCVHMWSI